MKQPALMETVAAAVRPQLISKYFFLILFGSLFANLALQFFNATTSLYVESLGGTASFTGILLTLFTIAAMVVRILTGRLVDTKGRRMIIITGLLIFALASVSFAIFPYLGALPVLRFIQGVGFSISATALAVAITDVIPKERMGEGIGYFGLGQAIPTAVGPAAAIGLIAGHHFNSVFYAAAAVLLLGAGLIAFCDYEKKSPAKSGLKVNAETGNKAVLSVAGPSGRLWVYFEKTAIPCTVISLFSSIAVSATTAFLLLFAFERGIEHAGLYFTLSAVCMVIARLSTGKLTDRYGPMYTLFPGFLMMILGFIMLMASSSYPVLYYISGILAGLGNGIIAPALNATVIKAAPDNRRGAASATFLISFDVGFGIGGLLWGIVIDAAGYTAMFFGCALLMAVALSLSVFFFGRKA
jgi:MFS family permease